MPDYDSAHAESGHKYRVVIENGYICGENGIAFEIETYANTMINIAAYIPDGYTFVGWEVTGADNCVVGTNATTEVRVPAADIALRAIIERTNQDNGDAETHNNNSYVWIIIVVSAIMIGAVVVFLILRKKKSA